MPNQFAIVYQMCSTCFKGDEKYPVFRQTLIDLLDTKGFKSTKNQTVFISEEGLENPREKAEEVASEIHGKDPDCKYLKRLDYFAVEDNYNLLEPHCGCGSEPC